MQATMIIPYDDESIDIDGDVSGGIRVIAGKLTCQQLEDLLVEPVYKRRAVLRQYDLKGEFVGLRVTFHAYDAEPANVDETDSSHRHVGQAYYQYEHPGTGKLAYEVRYIELEKQPGMCTYMLTMTWEEPTEGSSAYSCRLADAEAGQVDAAISWLEAKAGNEWGNTLGAWELRAESELVGDVDLDGLDAVLDELMLNSRYDEDPNHYGPERYPPFEARNAAVQAAAKKRLGVAGLAPFEGTGEMGG